MDTSCSSVDICITNTFACLINCKWDLGGLLAIVFHWPKTLRIDLFRWPLRHTTVSKAVRILLRILWIDNLISSLQLYLSLKRIICLDSYGLFFFRSWSDVTKVELTEIFTKWQGIIYRNITVNMFFFLLNWCGHLCHVTSFGDSHRTVYCA